MTLHKRHTHGRVFTGDEARDLLAIHKRDSHGSEIKMHVPSEYAVQNKGAAQTSVQTDVSVVYVTLAQTFSGPAIYSTMTGGDDSSAAATTPAAALGAQPTTSSAAALLNPDESSYAAQKSAANAVSSSSATSIPALANAANTQTSASPMTTMATSATAALAVTGSSSYAGNVVGGSPVQATRSATANPDTIDATSSGMTGGAKAGLAFGIIIALALAAGLIFFCWRRRKNPNGHEEIVDEKHASFVDAKAKSVESGGRASVMSEKVPASIRSTRTTSTAPRLSLRPVTQFLPNLSGEPTRSTGNNLDVAAASLAVSEKPTKSAWERRPVGSGPANPFDDAAVLTDKQARPESPPTNPFEEPNAGSAAETRSISSASSGKHTPKTSLTGSEPATPKSTKFGTAAAVPVAVPGNANAVSPPRGPGGPNNVHRVQLDFKPSMDDELELRSGQLVRMLHEYDDGWALCIRMDRSQQGVAPRTCLSKMPVKPRPQGPPNGRNSPPGPQGSGPRRPSNPQAPGAMFPRPLTPTQANRERGQSVTASESGSATATSPTSVPARKPVPGQAM